MKYIKERIQVIARQLRNLAKVQNVQLTNWQVKEGCYTSREEAEQSSELWKEFDSTTDRWYGPDRHYWFKTAVTVPESFDNKPLWLRIRTQLEEWEDGKNPQFLAMIDGKVIQGLDMNHREIFITEHAKAGESFRLDIQSYTGTIHNEFHLLGHLEEINREIEGLFYDIVVPLAAFDRMKDEKLVLDLETVLNNTINLIDLREPYSERFYQSISKARAYIAKALYEDMAGYDDIIATCIGHTHIDVAWLWTVAQVRQKSCRSFATVLKLMEEYPNYRFMSSQPQLYEFVKEQQPEVYKQICERIKEGRWEPEGGMWVEADCNLTSGESLVRQFLVGKRFFREEFNAENRILWLPDVFGYSAAIPQIMKKSGIDYFMTTKLAWNQYNKIPYDTFEWEGIDGTRVLTHFITTLSVGQSVENFFTTYNGNLHPDSIMGGWERYQNKDINNDILISYGFGDGGGGPTRTMLEISKRMEKGIKGIPKVRQESSRTYFEELEERVKDNKRLPAWVGELYFEYHRGTYTSMARNKRSNRKAEYRMMDLELLSVLAKKYGKEYPTEELKQMWKLILRNQFHDILPGSSIKEVYDVTKKEYEEIDQLSSKLLKECLETIISQGEGITIFNTLGFEREGIVELKDINIKGNAVTDGNKVIPVQKTEQGGVAYVTGLLSKGYQCFEFTTIEPCNTPFTIKENTIETPFYQIEFDFCGRISSFYDKENERQILKKGMFGNEFVVYEDKPMNYSNWDIDVYYQEKFWSVDDKAVMQWIEQGPVRAALLIEKQFIHTKIKQTIYFYADSRRIDFETYVDWKMSEHLMKVQFPVDVHTDEATFDIQFGNVKRKIHQNTSWDAARFESCAHKWVDLSEGDYGVSLMNDCKYGHSIKNGVMSLTLIKSGTDPNKTTDQEEHYFTYSLYPHAKTWQEANTVKEAFQLNVPVHVVSGGKTGEHYSYACVDSRNVVLETIKEAEDGNGTILRLYEIENKRTKVTVTMADKIGKIEETNLMEESLLENTIVTKENQFVFTIQPYEIKTFRVCSES